MTTYTAWYMAIAAIIHGQVIKTNHFCSALQEVSIYGFFFRFPDNCGVDLLLQADNVQHSAPTKLVLYFTGATNILYTFGGHAVTV
jgi:auxin influx carrier (AUX1 LAX family)